MEQAGRFINFGLAGRIYVAVAAGKGGLKQFWLARRYFSLEQNVGAAAVGVDPQRGKLFQAGDGGLSAGLEYFLCTPRAYTWYAEQVIARDLVDF